jgi:hypothetical protein
MPSKPEAQYSQNTLVFQQDVNVQPLLDAQFSLGELISRLGAIKDKLQPFDTALKGTVSKETIAQFGVRITTSEGLAADAWSPERIQQAYTAIINIIHSFASQFFGGDNLFGLIQFMETFGGVEIQLKEGSDGGGGNYARTSPDGTIIYLYTAPSILLQTDLDRCAAGLGKADVTSAECASAGYTLHSAENIVHEFGHVLAFQLAGEVVSTWDKLRNLLNVPIGETGYSYFETTLGWGQEIIDHLQNRSTYRDDVLTGHMSTTELENERVANMFQALVYQYRPLLDDSTSEKRRAAWLMWIFMTGECPPPDVFAGRDTPPCGDQITSLKEWIQVLGERK